MEDDLTILLNGRRPPIFGRPHLFWLMEEDQSFFGKLKTTKPFLVTGIRLIFLLIGRRLNPFLVNRRCLNLFWLMEDD